MVKYDLSGLSSKEPKSDPAQEQTVKIYTLSKSSDSNVLEGEPLDENMGYMYITDEGFLKIEFASETQLRIEMQFTEDGSTVNKKSFLISDLKTNLLSLQLNLSDSQMDSIIAQIDAVKNLRLKPKLTEPTAEPTIKTSTEPAKPKEPIIEPPPTTLAEPKPPKAIKPLKTPKKPKIPKEPMAEPTIKINKKILFDLYRKILENFNNYEDEPMNTQDFFKAIQLSIVYLKNDKTKGSMTLEEFDEAEFYHQIITSNSGIEEKSDLEKLLTLAQKYQADFPSVKPKKPSTTSTSTPLSTENESAMLEENDTILKMNNENYVVQLYIMDNNYNLSVDRIHDMHSMYDDVKEVKHHAEFIASLSFLHNSPYEFSEEIIQQFIGLINNIKPKITEEGISIDLQAKGVEKRIIINDLLDTKEMKIIFKPIARDKLKEDQVGLDFTITDKTTSQTEHAFARVRDEYLEIFRNNTIFTNISERDISKLNDLWDTDIEKWFERYNSTFDATVSILKPQSIKFGNNIVYIEINETDFHKPSYKFSIFDKGTQKTHYDVIYSEKEIMDHLSDKDNALTYQLTPSDLTKFQSFFKELDQIRKDYAKQTEEKKAKAEKERKEREEAEKAEKERKAKEEQEEAQKQFQAMQELIKEQERLKAEQKAKEEAEKAEKERKAKEEAEKKAKEEAEKNQNEIKLAKLREEAQRRKEEAEKKKASKKTQPKVLSDKQKLFLEETKKKFTNEEWASLGDDITKAILNLSDVKIDAQIGDADKREIFDLISAKDIIAMLNID